MLEINDELMTPGCPQCAIKHLSAALYYAAEDYAKGRRYGVPDQQPEPDRVLLARAYINLAEVLIGYESHLWFAVGLLQRSEEEALCSYREGRGGIARTARLMLEEGGSGNVGHAMQYIRREALFDPIEMQYAHTAEARRELPVDDGDYLDYAGAIERIRKEYFVEEGQPAAPQKEGEEEGGETKMATKKAAAKAPAKKADAKAVQAACKGGKCKGKKCK